MSAYSNEYIWKTNKEEINMKRKNLVKKSTTISVCQPITQMIFQEYRRFRKKTWETWNTVELADCVGRTYILPVFWWCSRLTVTRRVPVIEQESIPFRSTYVHLRFWVEIVLCTKLKILENGLNKPHWSARYELYIIY
jgi:hypothetical protein